LICPRNQAEEITEDARYCNGFFNYFAAIRLGTPLREAPSISRPAIGTGFGQWLSLILFGTSVYAWRPKIQA